MDNSIMCFVGLDYHQDSVQVCVLDRQGRQLVNKSCPNDWRAIAHVAGGAGRVKRAAIEACSGAADLAEELIEQAGWQVDLGHPQYIAKIKGSPDKSDFSDGRLLADLTRVGYLPRVHLPSGYERDLRQLVACRQALVDQRRAVKLRLGAVLREQRARTPKDLSRWTRAWVQWAWQAAPLSPAARWIVGSLLEDLAYLNRKVLAAEGQLEQATGRDPLVGQLLQQPGIGPVTAWVLRAHVGRFDRFGRGKQLSRYCGLSPCNASSGQRRADAGLVRGCNKLLRATLIQAAHRLIRTQGRWRALAEALKGQGKAKGVVVAAVANRWMRGLWHTMTQGSPLRQRSGLPSAPPAGGSARPGGTGSAHA